MKKILRIARIEINLLFYSPIAWLLMIIFMMMSASSFLDKLGEYEQMQEMGITSFSSMHNLTAAIFVDQSPYFPAFLPKVADSLYWFIPLITMGLLSREISSGTIKLLYSSPLKVIDIILGKFVAMLIIDLLMTLIIGIMVIIGLLVIQSPEINLTLSGLTAIFLLLCAYSAIGIFVSCLTEYQVVAAIATFAVFGFLGYVGSIWQFLDFMRDLTAFFSITGRTDNFFSGLITSTDIIYFLLITVMFLVFSGFYLQQQRETKSKLKQWGRYVLTIFIVIAIGYCSSLPAFTLYADVTVTKANTLTKGTRDLMRKIGDQPLEVNSYVNILDEQTAELGLPQQRKADEKRWSLYTRFKPDIKFTYTYFYDSVTTPKFYAKYHGRSLKSIAQQVSQGFNLDMKTIKTPEQIHKIVAMPLEMGRYCIQLKFRNKTTFLRMSDVDNFHYPLEPQIAAGLKRLLIDHMPKYVFLQGELERNPYGAAERDYGDFNKVWLREALVNQGFDMDTINLHRQSITTDITGLVIADPRINFDPIIRKKIQSFIDQGGNLMIMGKTGKQSLINPLIQQFGVNMAEGMLISNASQFGQEVVFPKLTDDCIHISHGLNKLITDSAALCFPGATALYYNQNSQYHVFPLSITNPKTSWLRNKIDALDSAEIIYSPLKGDNKGPFATMVGVTRYVNGKEQRIAISSDADWLANGTVGFPRKIWIPNSNKDFVNAIFGWMTNGAFPPDLNRPLDKDRHLYIKGTTLPYLRTLLVWVIPGILIVIAIVLLLRRKRK